MLGDVATQWFADRDMFCAGRVTEEDLKRTQKACGGLIHSVTSNLTAPEALGQCENFEEVQIGNERFVLSIIIRKINSFAFRSILCNR